VNARLKVAVFLLVASPLGLGAQQSSSKTPLTPVQLQGKGLFKQRCSVCHTSMIVGIVKGEPVMLTTNTYGPVLTNEILSTGLESVVRERIRTGSDKMPGFQYGLKPAQIDAIIAYMKTIEKTSQMGASGATANPD
jgi:mono/diheme cytochrome c family protein